MITPALKSSGVKITCTALKPVKVYCLMGCPLMLWTQSPTSYPNLMESKSMTQLELVNSELTKVNLRVEELTTRKAEIIAQANDLFSENGANAAAELSIIETKLAQAPRQLAALEAQRASLEREDLKPQLDPLFDE